MKALLSIFSLFIFMSSQGMAQTCMSDCSHNLKKEASQNSEHNCCERLKSSSDKEKSNECESGNCLISANFNPSVFTIENPHEKKELDAPFVIESHNYRLVSLSNLALSPNYKNTWHYPYKVPIYISFKKLLLP